MRCSVDPELSEKLQTELEMETEMRDPEKLPTSISDYLSSSSFEVQLCFGTPTNVRMLICCSSTIRQEGKMLCSPGNLVTKSTVSCYTSYL